MADPSVIFDTHRFITRLTDAGLAQPIAEALADEQVQLLERNLATKADIATLQKVTQADIANAKVEIIKWNLGTLLALAALGVAALSAWPQ